MQDDNKRPTYPISVSPPTPVVPGVVSQLNKRIKEGYAVTLRPVPTGFDPLDQYMSGGFHSEDLVLIGGIQGVGKTVSMLQIARSTALHNRQAIVVCYEHSPIILLFRLLCMESYFNKTHPKLTWRELRQTMIELGIRQPEQNDFDRVLLALPSAEEAYSRMLGYAEGLWFVGGDGSHTTVDVLDTYVQDAIWQGHGSPVLFVDYCQIVPVRPNPMGIRPEGNERIAQVMMELKSIATRHQAIVVSVAAADEQSLRRQRVHLEDLMGPALMQYQPDTAIILNRGTMSSEGEGPAQIRLGLEKQRNGPQGLEFEYALHGAQFCFNPAGRLVTAEESYQSERMRLKET